MNTLSLERHRVLIVDDQKNWREALCDMLDPAYEIEAATSHEEAKRQLWQRAFHVFVADQRLVDADVTNIEGILLLDEVAKLRDGTQTIIVTAYPTVEAAKEALRGRNAFDYLLKRPEEGGPFNTRQYRARVKEATERAIKLREKAITLDFSVSAVVAGLTYDQIAETIFPSCMISHDRRESVWEMTTRLFYPFQPLAYGMGRAWLSRTDQLCDILCWSRGCSKAVLLRIGREQCLLAVREVEWLRESWHLVKDEELVYTPLLGILYTINGMTFDDFVKLAEGG